MRSLLNVLLMLFTLSPAGRACNSTRSSGVDAAKKMGMNPRTLQHYITTFPKRFGITPPESTNPITLATSRAKRPALITATHEIPELPDDDLPVEEIIEMRKREFAQKKAHEEATKLIPIKIKVNGPIGILHFGDPHLDDDGMDIGEAFRHAELTRTVDGLFGANLGDTTNNWVGRLAMLYSQQNMGRKRAIRVAEHFIRSARWLYMIGGNHDRKLVGEATECLVLLLRNNYNLQFFFFR